MGVMRRQRQRSAEIAKKRADAKARKESKKHAELLKSRVAVNSAALCPTNSYGAPHFVQRGYYQDQPFRCTDCGKQEIWTARQQRWWYELAKGDVWTRAYFRGVEKGLRTSTLNCLKSATLRVTTVKP